MDLIELSKSLVYVRWTLSFFLLLFLEYSETFNLHSERHL